MQNTFEINSESGNYTIIVGQDIVKGLADTHANAVYIFDAKLGDTLPLNATRRIAINAEEYNKSLEYMPQVITALRECHATRDTHVVAIGGGIIQDITTFAVSIYMRGLAWTYVATTMLSMVDSCIGGKSSINVGTYKNLVGNFYPPSQVIIDTNYILTLDREMLVGGLFEAAKICYASGYDQFEKYLALHPGYPQDPAAAVEIVLCSLMAKKWFIEIDEFDRNERLLLNFGHTFGHAIEAATDFGISHGIGVGVGMLVACQFARQAGGLFELGKQRITRLESHIVDSLSPHMNPVIAAPPSIAIEAVLQKFQFDKKHMANRYRMVIPDAEGLLELVALDRVPATTAVVRAAYEAALAQLAWPIH